MKSFQDFLKEYSGYDIGMNAVGKTPMSGEQEDQLGRLFKATKRAAAKYPMAVMSLLRRLARHDPEIQQELNGIEELGIAKLRTAANRGQNTMGPMGGNDGGDVVVPNSADGGGMGDMQ
jgi:hypothetical protein